MIDRRKEEHIILALLEESQYGSSWLDEVYLIHNALPELDLSDIDLTARFLGVRVSAPLGIGAITGGTELAGRINAALARAAEELGIPIYVGSQRIALLKPEIRWTFEVVRQNAPTVPKVANLGAPQLAKLPEEELAEWASQAVEMIDAHAIAIHLNAVQEVIQPEGEPGLKGVLEKITAVRRAVGRPVIVKEVGCGISKEAAARLSAAADAIDVGGFGGTSFAAIEGARAQITGAWLHKRIAETFRQWGIPTAASICEVKSVYSGFIIASGGIRSGLDGVKALALGAHFFTMSYPLLRAAVEGRIKEEVEAIMMEVKVAMFLLGARKVEDLARAPRVYGPRLKGWIEQRDLKC
ncbi:MAG: type 2 isopentenyl-diphosphate Delta-isomerase [Thermoproteaceae archaeon]|nr:type 2 isopentenyl-diphosphate Delta-isomerase [Thermoproteaceae archaeon]